ncbi:hypothetical protein [Agromyces binzhouensis]|uniref:Guanylate cyclase domain-containing protein n=1 Tax=Agromyces binzhouensis TaxID=1817495 RepID=A0A4Q2JN70_9MICO|nr:hypothetical protein [Agromyces binzhouensis]RXZ48444.1 hypothetical protein ESO86_06475 [Agromyces binzhouensis]
MSGFSREEAAGRAGVDVTYVERLVSLGIIAPTGQDRFSAGDVRRILMARSLEEVAIPLERLATALEHGALSLGFFDAEAYERFAPLTGETFQQVSERTGVPIDLLTTIREAIGSPLPSPDDLMREDEMAVVPFLELQIAEGFRPASIERLLRVQGESTRRMAEAEAAWWNAEVVEPAMAAGRSADEIGNPEFADRSTPLAERAMLGLYHAQQARAWTSNIIEGFEVLMARAGIHSHLERPPAICFFDITGYTRLTQERGDEAAADLAATLARTRGAQGRAGGDAPLPRRVRLRAADPAPALSDSRKNAGSFRVEEHETWSRRSPGT